MTRYAALLIGLVILLLGALGLFQPATFLDAVAFFQKGKNVYIAAAIRIVIGLVLFFGAKDCRWPRIMRPAATVLVLVGILTIVSTHPIPSVALGWWRGDFVRPWAISAIALGVFVIAAAAPPRDLED